MKLLKVIVPVALVLGAVISYNTWNGSRSGREQDLQSHSRVDPRLKLREHPKSQILERLINPAIHWEERVHAVGQLPEHLDAATRTGLVEYLTNQPAGESQKDWYLVANEIMQTLRQRELPAGFYTEHLVALIESSTVDAVIRDYAVQHLSQWISGIVPAARETDPVQISGAFAAMCRQAAAVENGHLTLVGTTLNALADLLVHRQGPMVAQREEFLGMALKIAATADGSVLPFNRASALQAAARLDAPELPQLCRQLVHHPDLTPDLRLGSVAALGLVGDAGDVVLLQSFAPDSQFHYAATAAIQRIQDRASSH